MDRNQIVWRCRRGVRELDVLFGRFLDTEYDLLSQQQQADFARLLEVQDPTIMDWLFGRSPPQDEFKGLITRLQELSGLS